MNGTSFNFFGGADPLLGGGDLNSYVQSMERMQAEIESKKQQLLQMSKQPQPQPQQQVSQSPVWDEIEKVIGELSDKEFERVASNESFIESQNNIMAILQAVQLKMMRPIVEGTPEGKKALEEHLSLVKHLKKNVSKEVDKEMRDFLEYQEHYSHLSWNDYVTQKGKKGGKK